ncbi:hypothetical protein HMPREF2883_12590, partial [Actinomyces sp. HMSC075C01]
MSLMARFGCRDRDLAVEAIAAWAPWARRMRPGGQVTQGGHDLWAVAGAQLVAVLIEDDVSDPVKSVLYPPVSLDPGGDGLGLGVGHGQGAHQVDHLNALAAFDGSGAADLDHLRRPREVHPLRDLEGLDGAPHPPTVRGVDPGDGRDTLEGQGLERPAQGLVVVQRRQEVVTTTPADPPGGVRLGVHGVSAHHDPVQAWGFKQDPESRNLWLDLLATRSWVSTAPVAWSK